jgi:hypothetical protein
MQTNDIINGLFELGSGLLCYLNIHRLLKDKQVQGVSWIPTTMFTLWGAWNLYYYPSLGQFFSMAGAVSIFMANLWWLWLVFYYEYPLILNLHWLRRRHWKALFAPAHRYSRNDGSRFCSPRVRFWCRVNGHPGSVSTTSTPYSGRMMVCDVCGDTIYDTHGR